MSHSCRSPKMRETGGNLACLLLSLYLYLSLLLSISLSRYLSISLSLSLSSYFYLYPSSYPSTTVNFLPEGGCGQRSLVSGRWVCFHIEGKPFLRTDIIVWMKMANTNQIYIISTSPPHSPSSGICCMISSLLKMGSRYNQVAWTFSHSSMISCMVCSFASQVLNSVSKGPMKGDDRMVCTFTM
eukprot:sb/3471448/